MVEIAVSMKMKQLSKLLKSVDQSVAMTLIAESAAELTREHLQALANARHRGRTPFNFYLRARDSVLSDSDNSSATITIPHVGIALRYYGGVVKPSGKNSLVTGNPIKKLALPLKGSEGEVKTPAEFSDIFFCLSKKGNGLLVSEKYGPVFVLLDQTKHKKDKSVLPTDKAYVKQAAEVLMAYVEEEIRRNGGTLNG